MEGGLGGGKAAQGRKEVSAWYRYTVSWRGGTNLSSGHGELHLLARELGLDGKRGRVGDARPLESGDHVDTGELGGRREINELGERCEQRKGELDDLR